MKPRAELSPNVSSRIAGFWYLALAVFGALGILVADSRFPSSGDPAAVAALIQADTLVFRLGIASNLIGQTCFLFVGLAFYRLFITVDKNQARILLALVVAAVPIAFAFALNKAAVLVLLTDGGLAKVFDPAQLQALALFFLKVQDQGTIILGVFWGLWLLPLGTLTWRSGLFPKVFGVLLWINGASYLVDASLGIVFPGVRTLAAPVIGITGVIGEIPFLLWLLFVGARVPKTPAELAP